MPRLLPVGVTLHLKWCMSILYYNTACLDASTAHDSCMLFRWLQEYLQSLLKQLSIIVIQWFAVPCPLWTQEQAKCRATNLYGWQDGIPQASWVQINCRKCFQLPTINKRLFHVYKPISKKAISLIFIDQIHVIITCSSIYDNKQWHTRYWHVCSNELSAGMLWWW